MSRFSDAELHDYLDGELDPTAVDAIESALDDATRARLDSLRAARRALSELPTEAAPPSDLWPSIEARIASSSARESEPIPLVTPLARPTWTTGRQLLAASVVLLAIAGSYALGAARSGPAPAPTAVAERGGTGESMGETPVEVPAAGPLSGDVILTIDRASEELEAVLREGASRLQPDTREILETSLATIDQAIAEARAALAADPGSPLVERRLVQALQFKLGVLRQGVSAVQRAT